MYCRSSIPGAGPHKANEALAAYLEAERRLGRVGAEIDPGATAALLLGACFQRAFFRHFLNEREALAGATDSFVDDLVRTLHQGLAPPIAG